MDVPRLSTLQALLMILKAREAAPKRGYYYRSWMTVVQCVQMAKDLGLDEHHEAHQAGHACDSSPAECQLRTRIWQTIFVCEVMVGTPQGLRPRVLRRCTRTSTHARPLTLEKRPSRLVRQTRVRRLRRPRQDGGRRRRRIPGVAEFHLLCPACAQHWQNEQSLCKDWEEERMGHGPGILAAQPEHHLVLVRTAGGHGPDVSVRQLAPWVPSSFLGNLHSYYHLTLILYHRPVLSFLDPTASESQWKHHMSICYDAAKSLCRLQEGILQTFGLMGLQVMQRGFSFTVYAGLSCIVLHLVSRPASAPAASWVHAPPRRPRANSRRRLPSCRRTPSSTRTPRSTSRAT